MNKNHKTELKNYISDRSQVYYTYSQYLKKTYGEKVYKLPINLPITCPNRDGHISKGGCIFCSELGTGFESQSNILNVKDQLVANKLIISKKYKANKFIAYFQNYTNTYMPFDLFKKRIEDSVIEDIVGISISTRPDCIMDEQLEFLKAFSILKKIDIDIELGLQTTNDQTLNWLNRGHDVKCFEEAVNKIHQYGFKVCVHLIPNLPPDTMTDIKDMVLLINRLQIEFIKLHSLYIAKNTKLGQMYLNEELRLISKEDYQQRIIYILTHISKQVVVQRLYARVPKEETLFCNWGNSWRKLHNELINEMAEKNLYQGMYYGGVKSEPEI